MSIEVQKAPNISQIGFDRSDRSNNDRQFCLDESGVITSKKVLSKPDTITKEPISKDKIEDMASKYSDHYDSYEDDFEDGSPQRNGSRTRTRERRRSSLSRDDTRSDTTVTPPRRSKKNTNSRRDSLMSYRSAYGHSRGKIHFETFGSFILNLR
jgi:hypothetical protein